MTEEASEKKAVPMGDSSNSLIQKIFSHVEKILGDFFNLKQGLASSSVVLIDPACSRSSLLEQAIGHPGFSQNSPRLILGIDRDSKVLRTLHKKLLRTDKGRSPSVRLRAEFLLDMHLALPQAELENNHIVICGFPETIENVEENKLQKYWLQEMGPNQPELKEILNLYLCYDKRKFLYSHILYWCWAMAQLRQSRVGGLIGFWTPKAILEDPRLQWMRDTMMSRFDEVHIVDIEGVDEQGQKINFGSESIYHEPSHMVFCVERAKKKISSETNEKERFCWVQFVSERLNEELSVNSVKKEAKFNRKNDKADRKKISHNWDILTSISPWPNDWISLDELFPFFRTGVQTARDKVAIAHTKKELLRKVEAFLKNDFEIHRDEAFNPKSYFDPEFAREKLKEKPLAQWMEKIDYRPFDKRWFVNCSPFCHRPRKSLQNALKQSQFCLMTVKEDVGSAEWSHFGAAVDIPDNGWLTTQGKNKTIVFPTHNPLGAVNVDATILKDVTQNVGRVISAESIFYFAFAFMAAEPYRKKYGHALKKGFAVLPIPNEQTFESLVEKGKKLVQVFCFQPGASKSEVGEIRIGHRKFSSGKSNLKQMFSTANTLVEHILT